MQLHKQHSTKIYLITGYLGAGKTTTLKRLLDSSDQTDSVAVLVNETAEHALDGDELKGYGYPVLQLSNGCVCCDKRGELGEAIQTLLQDHQPKVLYVETTGVAHPQPLIEYLNTLHIEAECSILTVIDAYRYSRTHSLGEISRQQIMSSSAVVITKTDLVEETEELKQKITRIRPEVKIFEEKPSSQQLSNVKVLRMCEDDKSYKPSHYENSITIRSDPSVDRIHELIVNNPNIQRAKGVTQGVRFHYSIGVFDQKHTDEEKNVVVIIGKIDMFSSARMIWQLRPRDKLLTYLTKHVLVLFRVSK